MIKCWQIWTIVSLIIFDEKAERYEKNAEWFLKFPMLKRNHKFFKSRVTSDGMWTYDIQVDNQDVGSLDIGGQLLTVHCWQFESWWST